jgi:hypothetical protein
MNHHAQNILPMKPDYNAVTLKLNTATEHWVTIFASHVTNCSVSWRRQEVELMECHIISTTSVAVQARQCNLTSWLSESVAMSVQKREHEGQEGVNTGD